MTTKFVQEGDKMDWTNGTGAAVASGDIVAVGARIGVAQTDIADGATGALAMTGVFDLPKVAATALTQGQLLGYNGTNANLEDNEAVGVTVTNAAIAWAAAAAADTTVPAKINP